MYNFDKCIRLSKHYHDQNIKLGDFPGGSVVTTSPSSAGAVGLIPRWGAKIPHASRPKNQNI